MYRGSISVTVLYPITSPAVRLRSRLEWLFIGTFIGSRVERTLDASSSLDCRRCNDGGNGILKRDCGHGHTGLY